ncbi:MAG: guanylate kinase [Polyangiaceae bacterium]
MLILASPSGAGKTTLKNMLLAEYPDLRFSISHTTRARRSHEEDGREYHFVQRNVFESMIENGSFVEFAEVHGNLYGTSLDSIESARKTYRGVVLDVDYQGARQIKARIPDAVTVFILPPSLAELERRLRARQDEGEESIRTRLQNARGEVAQYAMFDYLVLNDQLDRAFDALHSIVVAERHRRSRCARVAERLLREWQDPWPSPPMSIRGS